MQLEGHSRLKEALRISGSIAALLVFGLLATGCSLRKSPSGSSGSAQPLQVRIWRMNEDIDPLQGTIDRFNSDNQGVAQATYFKKPVADYELNALKSLAARQGPDIWSIPDDWIGDHITRINPLPDSFFQNQDGMSTLGALDAAKALYPPGIVEQITSSDGKSIMGVPSDVDYLQLYYNQDFFDSALNRFRQSLGDNVDDSVYTPVQQLLSNPPATWSDLVNQIKYLTIKNGSAIQQGAIALGTADNLPDPADTLQLLMLQNGVRIVSTDRTRAAFHLTTSAPAGGTIRPGQNALDFFTSFSNPNNANYSWNASMPDALDAFAQGKVGMVIAFSDFGTQLKSKYPNFNFQVASVPQISPAAVQPNVNLIKFNVEVITQTADSYEAAWKFLRRYAGPDVMDDIVSTDGYQTPFLQELQSRKDQFPQSAVLTGQAVYKKSRTQFDAAFNQMIIDVNQNGIPSSQALDSAAETINGLLASPNQ